VIWVPITGTPTEPVQERQLALRVRRSGGWLNTAQQLGDEMANFYEFFAGGGMARAGLGPQWECVFANDIDKKKSASYAANWGDRQLCIRDVAAVSVSELPGRAELAWASFPCQDLSLAGDGDGLKGERSGTFWPFWKLIKLLAEDERAPRIVAIENVCGTLTSHDGKDFAAICTALASAGYRYGAVVMNAVHFLPQSRPRLFIIGVHKDLAIPSGLTGEGKDDLWHPRALVGAYGKLSKRAQAAWVWWQLPAPPRRATVLADLIEAEPDGVEWHRASETKRLITLMSPVNRAKVEAAKALGTRVIGTVYKRTRLGIQRAEVRFDDIAGCLRTPAGGSSRQTIMIIEGSSVRSRLLSPREAARLMGLPDTYRLPQSYNDAYHLAGDGVAVPVVRFLAAHLLEPLLQMAFPVEKAA
jgi:DNA (cytosine-5)-methyltransferase 1